MRFLNIVYTILLVMLAGQLSAQFTKVRGTITDKDTGDPIPFVFLVLKNHQKYGSVTNELGQYELAFVEAHRADTAIISHVGYENYSFPLSAMTDTINQLDIELKSTIITLSTVEVTQEYEPVGLIKRVLANIPKVYGHPRYVLQAYYREYSLNKKGYADFTEAMVAISDGAYASKKQTASVYLDHLETTGYSGDLSVALRYGNENPVNTLYEKQANSARVHNIHWMSAEGVNFFDAFDFRRLGVYLGNKDTLVKIGYEINPERAGISERALNMLSGWTKGELIINKTDLAILSNSRGNSDGDAFSEVTYNKVAGKYYPRRIFTTRGFDYGINDTHLETRMLIITNLINKQNVMKDYLRGTRIPRKKQLADIKHVNQGELDLKGIYLLDLPTDQALEVEKLRREKNLSLGRTLK